MKTKEEIIEPFIWKDNSGNPRIAIMDCLNAMEIYADQFKQSHIQVVMQAEGSDGAEGAAVGNSADGQSGRVGCVHNTLKYIGPWYSCETCGTHFNARAEAPPEGALPF